MKTFKLLIYEDDSSWVAGFEYNIKPKLAKEGVNLVIQHKLDDSTCSEDIEWLPKLILVDYDLGAQTGEEIISQMDDHPQLVHTSIFFYSGGESIENLKAIASKFKCGISCFIKDGDSLEQAVISQGCKPG